VPQIIFLAFLRIRKDRRGRPKTQPFPTSIAWYSHRQPKYYECLHPQQRRLWKGFTPRAYIDLAAETAF
jgi:hypothetical protein